MSFSLSNETFDERLICRKVRYVIFLFAAHFLPLYIGQGRPATWVVDSWRMAGYSGAHLKSQHSGKLRQEDPKVEPSLSNLAAK